MTVAEARAKWGEGRGVGLGLWRGWLTFFGRLSRRQFVTLLLAWLVVGLGLLVLLDGGVAWLDVGGNTTAFALPEGSGFATWVVQLLMWMGVAGAVVRRSRDAGWSWVVSAVPLALIALVPALALPLVLVVLGVVPPAGWVDRWSYLRRQARLESRPSRAEERLEEARREGVVVDSPDPFGVPESRAVGSSPAADAPVVESAEEFREWMYGGAEE